MSKIESLVKVYEQYVNLPWDRNLAGPQKVWFAIYDPDDERHLRPRLAAFQEATLKAGHGWLLLDLTDSFAEWMAQHEYRDAYFEQPEDMDLALADVGDSVSQLVEDFLTSEDVNEHTVVAILGLASLFGLVSASGLITKVAPHVRGRLLAFFPGKHEGSRWWLLGAGDGWNYLAVPISAASGVG